MGWGVTIMKKSVNTRKIRTLYKYLLSYTIILLIPLIFFTFLINTSILNSLKDQTLDAVKNNLIRIREQTEQKFNEMERIALSISDNLHLCPYVLKKNYYKAYEGISELKSYLYGNDFIYDIMLYIRGDDRIYAASQSSDMQLMFENIYKFENWGFEELFHDINTFKTPVLRPSETLSVCDIGKRRVITYIYPIKPYDPYAVVIFLIDTGKMQELLGGIIKKTDENIMILDGQKNIIVSLDNEEILMDVK
jgi:two-component system response regulator YesN